MSFQTIAFAFGCLLLLIGVVGGGFEVKELRLPVVNPIGRAIAAVLGGAFVILAYFNPDIAGGPPAKAGFQMSKMEFDANRFGGDYDNFEISADDPQRCETQCGKENRCKAWTYVKPNLQGVRPHCWMKDVVPEVRANPCCVSGVKLMD